MPPQMSGPPRHAAQASSKVQLVSGQGENDSQTSSPDSASRASSGRTSPSVWLPTFRPCPCSSSTYR